MKAALLCPGPSLRKFEGQSHRYGMIIGVNRAVMAFPCHWWSFCDADVYWQARPIDCSPFVWTRMETTKQIKATRYACHEGYFDRFPPTCCWTKYSSLAGLVLAGMFNAESVDCYGCDMTGVDEFDDNPLPGVNRHENRWADERHWWNETAAMLAPMTITRIL